MHWLTRAALVAACLFALPMLLPPPATAEPAIPDTSGRWGPDGLPYLAGRICDTPSGSAALVSWADPVDGRPAYALDAIIGPASDSAGPRRYARPALDPTAVGALSARADGMTAQQLAALGYLLARHGSSPRPGIVAAVAAAAASVRRQSPIVSACLAAGQVDGPAAAALWDEALQRAGPYTVRIGSAAPKLIMGQPDAVTATVTAASGAPVPGLHVSFVVAEADAGVRQAAVMTDAAGRATTALLLATGSTTRAVRVRATAQVPSGVSFAAAPGAVTLVSASAPVPASARTNVAVETSADPVLATSLTRAVVFKGTTVSAAMSVSGMRGHNGTGAVTMRGPLAFRPGTGCSNYTVADWSGLPGAAVATSVPGVAMVGDGSYPAGAVAVVDPGCYLLTGSVTTSNALPNVTRRSHGAVLAVVPLTVGLASGQGGVALPGRLSASITLHGTVAGRLAGLSGRLLGPMPSDDGSCEDADWNRAGDAAPVTVAPGPNGATLTSAPVRATGCYAFRASGTLEVPGAGSLPLPFGGSTAATTLVVDPSASVVGLSRSFARAGGQLDASVTVSGSYTEPGALRLQLLRLPYDWRGCFGRDWSHASVVTTAAAPAQPIAGDGTYSVRSPKIPSDGCWTVVPVLTLAANPAVRVADTAVADPMLAFTGVDLTVEAAPRDASDPTGSNGHAQLLLSLLLAGALLVAAAATTLTIAVRSDDE